MEGKKCSVLVATTQPGMDMLRRDAKNFSAKSEISKFESTNPASKWGSDIFAIMCNALRIGFIEHLECNLGWTPAFITAHAN